MFFYHTPGQRPPPLPDIVCCGSDLLCAHRFEQTPRPTAVVVVWWREETRWVRCTARRTGASEPTRSALVFGLEAERRAESTRLGISCLTM